VIAGTFSPWLDLIFCLAVNAGIRELEASRVVVALTDGTLGL